MKICVDLYKSLFHGRKDLFAVRLERNGKATYFPSYDYDPYQFRLHKMKGGTLQTFQNKTLNALTNDQIKRHLNGDHFIGVYPLLKVGQKETVSGWIGTIGKKNLSKFSFLLGNWFWSTRMALSFEPFRKNEILFHEDRVNQKTQKAGFHQPFAQKFLPKFLPRFVLTFVIY